MKNLKKILWGIPIGLINGFFGSGGGVIAVYVLKKFLDVDAKRAHATAISIILPMSCASLFFYQKEAPISFLLVLLCALGGCAGAFVGAKLLNKIPKKWLKIAFGAVMVFSGIRMIMR